MNNRLKELALEAGLMSTWEGWVSTQKKHTEGVCDEYLDRFAELVRQDEAKACAEHYLGIMRDAVEQAVLKEREDCANLCENVVSNEGYVQSKWCAKTIRQRGEK
jgi:hypothetical protein